MRDYVIVIGLLAGCGHEVPVQAQVLGVPEPSVQSTPSQNVRYYSSQYEQLPSPALLCGQRLLAATGARPLELERLPTLLRRNSHRKDEEFLMYMFAIISVESGFDRNARSERAAYGLMQLTAIAVEESVQHCNLKPVPDMEGLYDSATNIRYGTCYLSRALDELDGDWTRALILYNGGYRQLTKYSRGETISSETANYVLQVQRALNLCTLNPEGTTDDPTTN